MVTTGTIAGPTTELELLPALISGALSDGHSITAWRLPRSSEKHLLICTEGVRPVDDLSLEESLPGFVFAPYDRSAQKMFFRANIVVTFRDGLPDPETLPENYARRVMPDDAETEIPVAFHVISVPPNSPGDFRHVVANAVEAIRGGKLEKVVPSRFLDVPLDGAFDLIRSFQNLCDAYPNAMVSLVSSAETGTWMGATPELIVSLDDQAIFKTVALAGTQRHIPGADLKDVRWNDKEIEEQALVCRYIISCLKKLRVREYDEQGPRTSVAGNVLHLKTDFRIDTTAINFPQLASVMLALLHPTSAVCGMPLDAARQFLKMNEGYDRQYYSGFLGPVNFRNESHIYVNLRCLQLLENKIRLYAGAGVTLDSTPEKEWKETELKFETLFSIIY